MRSSVFVTIVECFVVNSFGSEKNVAYGNIKLKNGTGGYDTFA